MTIPALEKSWEFNVNIACGGQSTDERDCADYCIKVKNALVGFASGHWRVKASSDGTNADYEDRWNSPAALLWGTGDHAWIVLRNDTTGLEICFDFNNASARYAEMHVSPSAGFDVSDPSKSVRPTATDTMTWDSSDAFGAFNGNWRGRAHVMQSTDGECVRFLQCTNNNLVGVVLLEAIKDPMSTWVTNQFYCFAYGSSLGIDMYSRAYSAETYARTRYNSSLVGGFLTTEGTSGGPLGVLMTSPDPLTGEWLFAPVGLWILYGGYQGRKGSLYDLWFGPKALNPTGDAFPSNGTRQFVQFGFMVFPWNGSTPQVF